MAIPGPRKAEPGKPCQMGIRGLGHGDKSWSVTWDAFLGETGHLEASV